MAIINTSVIDNKISDILLGYDTDNLTIATVTSHSSLQIFDGARKEGFKTLGICIGKPPKFYNAFPLARPDEFLVVDSYSDILTKTEELAKKNIIIIPHGSFVEYLGHDNFIQLELPASSSSRGDPNLKISSALDSTRLPMLISSNVPFF